MGSNTNKIYNKAMDYYQNGEIDKALEKCEEGISQDLKNSNLLNLKGLLLYIKGDLKSATAVWNINRDFNDDDIAKVYIKDSKSDDTKLNLYEWAQVDIKDLKIDEAIKKLEKCAESDFNSINVNISLAICYLRKGNCLMASEFIEKVKQVDKKNKMAITVENQINEFFQDPNEKFKKKIFKYISAIAVICIIAGVSVIGINKINAGKSKETVAQKNDNTEKADHKENIDKSEDKNKVEETNKVEENKEDEKQEAQEQEVAESKYQFKDAAEIKSAYIKGSTYFDDKKYEEASEILKAAYSSEIDSYLKDDILFLLASSYYNNGLNKEAMKYFKEYAEKYKDKSYIIEATYNLALLYKDSNLELSKKYAEIIKEKYSSSIYYNTKIDDILNS